MTATCVGSEQTILFTDSATTGLKDGDHTIALSVGDISTPALAKMDSQSLVFGSSLALWLPLSAPIFSVADADARVVITARKLHRDWGDGAAAAITQVAAACAGRS